MGSAMKKVVRVVKGFFHGVRRIIQNVIGILMNKVEPKTTGNLREAEEFLAKRDDPAMSSKYMGARCHSRHLNDEAEETAKKLSANDKNALDAYLRQNSGP